MQAAREAPKARKPAIPAGLRWGLPYVQAMITAWSAGLLMSRLRCRKIQRADVAAVDLLRSHGVIWERFIEDPEIVYEVDDRIVAASAARTTSIAAPIYHPEPLPPISAAWSEGPHLTVVGTGLVILEGYDPRPIHRLARTLRSHEAGARFCVVQVPLPEHEVFDRAGLAQQIGAGSIADPRVTVPLIDGYFPTGLVRDEVVLVRRNEEF